MNTEYVPANKKVLIVILVLLAIYVGFRFNIESIVNHFISYNPELKNINVLLAERQEERKLIIQTVFLAIPSIVFFIIMGWLSYLVIRTKSIPPKSIYFPFGMKRLLGREAIFVGYIGMIASSIQIFSHRNLILLNIHRTFSPPDSTLHFFKASSPLKSIFPKNPRINVSSFSSEY